MNSTNKNRFIVIGIALVVFFAIVILPNLSGINDYARITKLHYTAVVEDAENTENPWQGSVVNVTERITFDIHAASRSNGFWELWRDLPEEWKDNERVLGYNVKSVKRLKADGTVDLEFQKASRLYWYDSDYVNTASNAASGLGPNRWFHSKGPYDDYKNFECVLLYVNNLYREVTEFEIEYELYGAAIEYADCAELYLPVYEGKNCDYLTEFSMEVKVNNNKMPDENNYHAWTYGTNSDPELVKTVGGGYTSFSFSLDKSQLKFKPYNRYLEFSLVAFGNGKSAFTQNIPSFRRYSFSAYSDLMQAQKDYEGLPAKYNTIKIVVLLVALAVSALVVCLIFFINKRLRKKHKLGKPSVDYDFYREIPEPLDASFAGSFVFCKHKLLDGAPGGYSAAMLGLVRKNYISVERIKEKGDWTAQNTKIILSQYRPPQPENLDPYQNSGQNQYQNPGQNPFQNSFQTPFHNPAFGAMTAPFQSAFQPQGTQQQGAQPQGGAEPLSTLPKLTETEDAYYRLICRHAVGGEISLTALQERVSADYQYTDKFVKSVKQSVKTVGLSKNYFKEADYKKLKKSAMSGVVGLIVAAAICFLFNIISYRTRLDFAFGAFFILGLALIAAAVVLGIKSRSLVLLTQAGEDEYSKWRGLYNFLNSETLIKDRTVPEVAIWEDYLIYATAFGISEKVIKALKVKLPEMPELSQTSSVIIRHPFLTSMIFTRMYTGSFRNATRSATFNSRTGGSFTSYSSGGRGGGSGGGGH